MRTFVAVLMMIHGGLHLLGFLKLWGLSGLPQLSGRTIVSLPPGALRAVGLLWLAAAIAFAAGAVLRYLDRDSWWVVAAATLVLSQLLIVLQWSDAWAGSVANLILALVVATAAATQLFHRTTDHEVRALLSAAPSIAAPLVRSGDLAGLPIAVRRWLEAAGVVGLPYAQTVRLRQRGGLRTTPGGRYFAAAAEQYFRIDEPGFVWSVDLTMMQVPVVGRDTYVDGRGRMLIKAGGLVTVADGTGPGFDQGTALRFLGEIIWFPSAALAPYISWKGIDEQNAEATLTFGDVSASARFEFDADGRPVALTARRFYNGESLETWVIPMTEWRTIRGVGMPVRGGAVWKLPGGDFDYYQWEIVDVEVNRPGLWRDG